MLRYRNTVSFLLTCMMYAAGATVLLYTNTIQVSEREASFKTIELSLQAYQPPVKESQPIKEKQPEPIKEEIAPEENIKPFPEPEIVKPEPLPIEPPKPEIKKPELPKMEVKKVQPKKTVKKPKKVKYAPAQNARQSIKNQQSAADAKNLFLNSIRERINRNKTYPRVAKRRGMQGSVLVSFTILPNGKVSNISVSGPNAFHSSAKEAVQKSFPVSVKNVPIALPQRVSFTMHYKLIK